MISSSSSLKQQGFTLIEIAIVLVIIGLLLGGLIMPLRAQRDINHRKTTELQLQEIRAALLGYALTNSKLPCPTNAAGLGLAPPVCVAANNLIPYATLGIQGTIKNGALVDVWQQPFLYKLANGYGTAIPIVGVAPILNICISSPCPTPATLITNIAVAVVLSTGKDGVDLPASVSPDQIENRDGDTDFVMRTPTEYDKTGVEFDDIVVWISHPTLIYELSRAGRL